jgi:hypothetical protein
MTMNNLAMSCSSGSAPADEYPFAGVAVAAHDGCTIKQAASGMAFLRRLITARPL